MSREKSSAKLFGAGRELVQLVALLTALCTSQGRHMLGRVFFCVSFFNLLPGSGEETQEELNTSAVPTGACSVSSN